MKRLMVSLVVLAMTALAACGGGASSKDDDAALDPDGALVIAHRTGVASWDISRSRGGPETELQGLIYDRLISVGESGEPGPGLAESWEFADDVSSLTLTLREGVTFTDGTPFDSSVVKANLERLKAPGTTTASQLTTIQAIETPDASTVTLTLSKPDTGVLLLLGDRFGMQMSPATFGAEEITEPVGTGMFKLASQQPGTTYELTRNDDYWDEDVVKLKTVTINVIADPKARLNAIRSGQADLTHVDAGDVAEAESISGATVEPFETIGTKTLYLNQNLVPEFADVRVRQALSLAIDRQAIVDSLLKGVGQAGTQLVPPIAKAFNEDLKATFDVAEAEALLKAAGAEGLSFSLAVQPPDTLFAEALQSQWAEIGVTVEIKTIDSFALGQAVWTDKTEDAGLVTFSGRIDPSFALAINYLPNAPSNPGNFDDPTLTKLIQDAQAEVDDAARIALLQEATAYAAENPQGAIPVFTIANGVLYRDRVKGVETWYLGFPRLQGVGVTK